MIPKANAICLNYGRNPVRYTGVNIETIKDLFPTGEEPVGGLIP